MKSQYPFMIGLIIFLGLALRLFNWGNYPFGFDQVQILENAQRIYDGDPTLIGPRTGPATFFTGPLVYYLTAIWFPFLYQPYSLFITSIIITLTTGVTLAYLDYHYYRQRFHTILIIFLWAVSSLLVSLDRVIWNPNLSLIAAFLCYYPMEKLIRQKPVVFDYVCLFAGSFLGYQAHFTGLLLPVVICCFWLILIRKQILIPAVSILGLMLTLIPTLIFDVRHHWLNLKGLQQLLSNSQATSFSLNFETIKHNIFISAENVGKIFIDYRSSSTIVATGTLLIFLSFFLIWRQNQSHLAFRRLNPILWILCIAILYGAYRQDKPEYYFIIQFPAILSLLTATITFLFHHDRFLGTAIITIFIFTNLKANYYQITEIGKLNLIDQIRTSQYLHTLAQSKPIKSIEYQMPHTSDIGLKYLLQDISLKDTGVQVNIIYPSQSYEQYAKTFGLIGIK